MKERKDLLRIWLRGKGFHPADIKFTLAWFEESVKAGLSPTDAEALATAEGSHKAAVGLIPTAPIQIVHQKRVVNELSETVINTIAMDKAFWGSLLGAFCALGVFEVLRWVLGLML